MVATESTMVPLGTPAPAFTLPDPDGKTVSLGEFEGQPIVVAFVCNHCPYVKHIAPELPSIVGSLHELGLAFVAINSNDFSAHPDDAPTAMIEFAAEHGWEFPYLVDEDQAVATSYRAACTPDFFLFDSEHELAYRGRMDASRPQSDDPVTGTDLVSAATAVVEGRSVPEPHHPSMGCNIKWRPGNEPAWFG